MKSRLNDAHLFSARDLALLDAELGKCFGEKILEFGQHHSFDADFISSHGHTVFHQPQFSFTTQIGSAPHIAVTTGLPVISDFRTKDVALGGQGAPLVPIGDLHLFPEFDVCLNLGGIANVSIKNENEIAAFDICVCNMALNFLAQKRNKEYDSGGHIASTGNLIERLFNQLNAISFFQNKQPKSLGREFFDKEIAPLIDDSTERVEDVMRTFVEHIAYQIGKSVGNGKSVLVSGGGAYNDFLIDRMKQHCKPQIVLPDNHTIQFKEALIFAFLGVLRMRGEVNCLAGVTGASRNNVGGSIYHP